MADALPPLTVNFHNKCSIRTFNRTGYHIQLPKLNFGALPDQISQQCTTTMIPGADTSMSIAFPTNFWSDFYGTQLETNIDMCASWYCDIGIEWGIRVAWPQQKIYPFAPISYPIWYYWITEKVGASPTWIENTPASQPLQVTNFKGYMDLIVIPTIDDQSMVLDVSIQDSAHSPDHNAMPT